MPDYYSLEFNELEIDVLTSVKKRAFTGVFLNMLVLKENARALLFSKDFTFPEKKNYVLQVISGNAHLKKLDVTITFSTFFKNLKHLKHAWPGRKAAHPSYCSNLFELTENDLNVLSMKMKNQFAKAYMRLFRDSGHLVTLIEAYGMPISDAFFYVKKCYLESYEEDQKMNLPTFTVFVKNEFNRGPKDQSNKVEKKIEADIPLDSPADRQLTIETPIEEKLVIKETTTGRQETIAERTNDLATRHDATGPGAVALEIVRDYLVHRKDFPVHLRRKLFEYEYEDFYGFLGSYGIDYEYYEEGIINEKNYPDERITRIKTKILGI